MVDLEALPKPRLDGGASLEEVLNRRRSVREFSSQPIELKDVSQLLWSAQGITDAKRLRTAPSAGALYPLDVYLVSSSGISLYEPGQHALRKRHDGDLRGALSHAALDQEFISQAPISVVITANFQRTERKYGRVRSPRYVHIEVGHAAQNLMLQATALGLGSVFVGAFSDRSVHEILELPKNHKVLAIIPIGYPI